MEKSNVDRLKEAVLYAPVGAFGFLKDNAPTFFSMFVSRGKRDVIKTTMTAEEKISGAKEHGQFVAMGTPVMRTRAEKLAGEAKHKGEDVAQMSLSVALSALDFLENAVKSLAANVSADSAASDTPQKSMPEKTTMERSGNIKAPSVTKAEVMPEVKEVTTYAADTLQKAEGDFIAEPLDTILPANIQGIYARLSAPEIIDLLDDYAGDELTKIRDHEADYRNRQTIIHAINFRLNEK